MRWMLMLGVVGGWVEYVIRRLLVAVVNLVVVPCKVVRLAVVASSFLERRFALLFLLPFVSCACVNKIGLPRL
jgi:hypothetical protein